MSRTASIFRPFAEARKAFDRHSSREAMIAVAPTQLRKAVLTSEKHRRNTLAKVLDLRRSGGARGVPVT